MVKYSKDLFTNPDNIDQDIEMGEMDTEVISELIIIKRQMLDSLYAAINNLGELKRASALDKTNEVVEANFIRNTFELFLKVNPLLSEKRISKFKQDVRPNLRAMLKDVNKYILEDTEITFEKWKEYFLLLLAVVRKLNVYGIGFVKDNPEDAWRSGMGE